MATSTIEQKLIQLGFELPLISAPLGAYVPAKQVGNLIYVSGQVPIRNGNPIFVGRVGAELSIDQGYHAAQLTILNCLAAIKSLTGSLDAIG